VCAGATLHLRRLTRVAKTSTPARLVVRAAVGRELLPTPVAEYAFSQHLEHPTLRTLLIGGDRLRQFNRNQHFDVINNYGPTEATVVATSVWSSGDARTSANR
jgi:arthrofactin-type cyclic lipopeptide synthetase C